MQCPSCKSNESKVVDKRNVLETGIIRRRRECLTCSHRFTTYEKIDMTDLMVVKKDMRREPFDAEKLKRGIMRACEKRPINMHQIDRLVDEVEDIIRKQHGTEIQSEIIGEYVINSLKRTDKVACVRFASVYKSFQNISEFESEVKNLLDVSE